MFSETAVWISPIVTTFLLLLIGLRLWVVIFLCILVFSSNLYAADINFFENLLENNFGID